MLHFYKMQGIGNDYVYVNAFENPVGDAPALARRVSDRHFGIGSDGLILLCPSDKADLAMRMYNQDGSEGKMCGNGIRCVGKLAYELGVCRKEDLTVDTLSGIKKLHLIAENGKVTRARVDMGAPILEAGKIPARFAKSPVIAAPMTAAGREWNVTCVSMGNPHAVIFLREPGGVDALDLPAIGPAFEKNERFPERVNTEFVEALGPKELKMRVWERGSGETMACGTGACAAAVAAVLNGLCPRSEDITVHLRGGALTIRWEDAVFMTGPAVLVFSGDLYD